LNRFALLMLAILCSPARAEPGATIKPGYWESASRVLSPIQSTKTDRRCVTPAEVKRFTSCYINHHYTCDCPDSSYDGGRIQFRGTCVDAKGQKVAIEGDGTYTPETLSMRAHVQFRLWGLPMTGEATTDAHRLGDLCPAP
jgi:hypothetical protein